MCAWVGLRDWAFQKRNGYRIYYGQDEYTKKKNFKGFPMFFTLENFKTALMGDIKQWSSRHCRRRYRRHRRHRRS
jgi:hypothetical protein